MPKADIMKRFVAAVIDGAISYIPSFIPVIGALIGSAYMLTKDAVVYELTQNEDFRNRSIGKKVMGLQVEVLGPETDVDWVISIKRNIPLAIGSIIMIIPVIGWVIGGALAIILGIIELVLVLTEESGRRIGDKFAETQVIETEAKTAES